MIFTPDQSRKSLVSDALTETGITRVVLAEQEACSTGLVKISAVEAVTGSSYGHRVTVVPGPEKVRVKLVRHDCVPSAQVWPWSGRCHVEARKNI